MLPAQTEADLIMARDKELTAKRQPYLGLWQHIGEYIHGTKQSFVANTMQGERYNKNLFNSTGVKANRKMVAALVGMLWQNGGKSIRLEPISSLPKTKAIKDYYEKISQACVRAMDDPKAGLTLALEEYMTDQGSFGTSGIGTFSGQDSDLLYMAYGVQNIKIAEGENGYVNCVYVDLEKDLRQAIEEYGIENLSDKLQELAKGGKLDSKVKILHAIEPRKLVQTEKLNNLSMPYKSVHIERDTKHIIKESGFEEMPIHIARFFKIYGSIYGGSPGADALPDVMELNVVTETRMLAQEKALDPPLGIMNDSVAGSNKIDTSAGAINVIRIKGQIGSQPPIFPIAPVGAIFEADKQIEMLKLSINEHFNIDRLLDFNNEAQMTLGEAQLRAKIRAEGLTSLFVRQIKELFTPMVERSVAILFRKGKLGVMPGTLEAKIDEIFGGEEVITIPEEVAELIQQGKDFYEIKYLSPAARLMEAEEAQGIMQVWEFAGNLAKVDPDALLCLDAEESVKKVGFIWGAPTGIFRSDEEVQKIKEMQAQQMEQQQAMMAAQQGAMIAKDATQADKQVSESQSA